MYCDEENTSRSVNFWERDKPIPSKEEIAEMTDLEELEEVQEALDATVERIRVGLEFPYDDVWERRAKTALTFFLIASKRVSQRRRDLMKIEGAESDPELEAFLEQQKQEKKLIKVKHQELVAKQAEASAIKDANRTLRHKFTMLRDISFHLAFYHETRRTISPELFEQIEQRAVTDFQNKLMKLWEASHDQ